MKQLHREGKLNAAQAFFMSKERSAEELYDLQAGPHEIRNLATDSRYEKTLKEMRGILNRWVMESDDRGRFRRAWRG